MRAVLFCALGVIVGCTAGGPADSEGAPPEEHLATTSAKLGSPTCLVFQRGVSGTVADTQIANGDPLRLNKNYGTSTVANTGVVPNAGARELLLQVDLSAIPAGSAVISAGVELTQDNTAAATVRVHRITAAWGEGTVTWASFGGAFSPLVDTAFSNGGPAGPSGVSFSIKALAQSWVNGAQPNHGILLEQDPVGETRYRTSEWIPATALRPRVSICYAAATCSDGIQDQGEKGVDCGGPCAECPHPPATEAVSGGDTSQSTHYKARYTLGQPTQNQDKTTSPTYRVQGGLIGANGSLP